MFFKLVLFRFFGVKYGSVDVEFLKNEELLYNLFIMGVDVDMAKRR